MVAEVTRMGVDDGFDALEGRYGNMIEMGIVDPLRVCRSALQNGASVAGLLLTVLVIPFPTYDRVENWVQYQLELIELEKR